MLRRIIVLSALAAGFSSFGASGVGSSGRRRVAAGGAAGCRRHPARPIWRCRNLLRRVRPARGRRRLYGRGDLGRASQARRTPSAPRRQRERRDVMRGEQERYYLDDPEDMERLRREKLRDGGVITAPPIDDYEDYSSRELPEGLDGISGAPRRAFPDEPEIIAREPAEQQIEREPLDNGVNRPAVAEAPAATPNIVEGAIDPSLKLRRARGCRRAADTARPPRRVAWRHRRPFRLERRQGDRRLSLDHQRKSEVDRHGGHQEGAGRERRRCLHQLHAHRGRRGRSLRRLGSGGLRREGQARQAELHLGHRDARRALPHGRELSQGAQSRGQFQPRRHHRPRRQCRPAVDAPGCAASSPTRARSRSSPTTPTTSSSSPIRRRSARPTRRRRPARISISRVVVDPDYTYNPDINFKQGENGKILTIPPGPNGPVGSIWIALDKPTYGVHGTPDPSKIGKTESHGCVRLTNWDAQELAKLVKPGVTVEFVD